MDILQALKIVKQHGYIVISKEELLNTIEIAVQRGIELYKENEKKNKLYSKKEVAHILNISPSTISRWVKQGKIKTTAEGYITYEEILRLLSK